MKVFQKFIKTFFLVFLILSFTNCSKRLKNKKKNELKKFLLNHLNDDMLVEESGEEEDIADKEFDTLSHYYKVLENVIKKDQSFKKEFSIKHQNNTKNFDSLKKLKEIFAVEINGNAQTASEIAKKYGFELAKHVKALGSVYKFIMKRSELAFDENNYKGSRNKRSYDKNLLSDPKVLRVEKQILLVREKRNIIPYLKKYFKEHNREKTAFDVNKNTESLYFNDPMFDKQWYLLNRGQTGGTRGYDLNVVPAWQMGFTGLNTVVSILDDGIDHTHPDLADNYDPEASADLNKLEGDDNDPMPNLKEPNNNHGTKCAGEVAAKANNSICCVGVAFNAKIGGIKMLEGKVTDLLEAQALLYNNHHIDIYSASWGPADNGRTMEGPKRYCSRAFKSGVETGRGGKGSIFVWATGNGGLYKDDCNCDGYVGSPYTLAIGSISDHGLSSYFSEICSSTMAVVFTGGSHLPPKKQHISYEVPVSVVTTDVALSCTTSFMGTSSAAPLAAACVALTLEANPSLTWRDVQHIVAETSIIPSEEEDGWVVNGGGYHVNERMGFGVLDCSSMVLAALNWTNVQEQKKCVVKYKGEPKLIEAAGSIKIEFNVSEVCQSFTSSSQKIDRLEHVQLKMEMSHKRRGDVAVHLTSPHGTTSKMLKQRPHDTSPEGIHFTFLSVRHWGEMPHGVWTMLITDHTGDAGAGIEEIPESQLFDRNQPNDFQFAHLNIFDKKISEKKVRGELRKVSLILRGVRGGLGNHEMWRGRDGEVNEDGKGDNTKMQKRKRNIENFLDEKYPF